MGQCFSDRISKQVRPVQKIEKQNQTSIIKNNGISTSERSDCVIFTNQTLFKRASNLFEFNQPQFNINDESFPKQKSEKQNNVEQEKQNEGNQTLNQLQKQTTNQSIGQQLQQDECSQKLDTQIKSEYNQTLSNIQVKQDKLKVQLQQVKQQYLDIQNENGNNLQKNNTSKGGKDEIIQINKAQNLIQASPLFTTKIKTFNYQANLLELQSNQVCQDDSSHIESKCSNQEDLLDFIKVRYYTTGKIGQEKCVQKQNSKRSIINNLSLEVGDNNNSIKSNDIEMAQAQDIGLNNKKKCVTNEDLEQKGKQISASPTEKGPNSCPVQKKSKVQSKKANNIDRKARVICQDYKKSSFYSQNLMEKEGTTPNKFCPSQMQKIYQVQNQKDKQINNDDSNVLSSSLERSLIFKFDENSVQTDQDKQSQQQQNNDNNVRETSYSQELTNRSQYPSVALNHLNENTLSQSFCESLNQSENINYSVDMRVKIRNPNVHFKKNFLQTQSISRSINFEGRKCLNQYVILKQLGRGAMGKVQLAQDQSQKNFYAIKIANKSAIKSNLFLAKSKQNKITQLQMEVAVMKKLDHPNIVKLVEVIEDQIKNKFYLVMEYCEQGAILSSQFFQSYLQQNNSELYNEIFNNDGTLKSQSLLPNKISSIHAKQYFRGIALALDYLHNYAQVIHRDIKPDNLLVDKNNNIKIADFGVSQLINGKTQSLRNHAGTSAYLAPEAFGLSEFQGKPLDIWAAGITLYQIIHGYLPFKTDNMASLRNQILKGEVNYSQIAQDEQLVDILKRCLEKNPAKRITASQLLTHPWITDNGIVTIKNEVVGQLSLNHQEISSSISQISIKMFINFWIAHILKKKLNLAKENLKCKQTQKQMV